MNGARGREWASWRSNGDTARMQVAVLDDYQRRAEQLADWASLRPDVDVSFFHEPLPDPADPYRATPNAARVLELAAQEARATGKPSFDAEDLLVATLHEANGAGSEALRALGITEARLRREIAGTKRPSEH